MSAARLYFRGPHPYAVPRPKSQPARWIVLLCVCAACGSPAAAGSATDAAPAATAPRILPAVATATLAPEPPTKPAPAPRPTSTPVLLASPTPVPEISLIFTGDINPGRCVYWHSKQAGDLSLPYRPLAHFLQEADITVGSLDGALSDYNPPPPCAEFHRNLLAPAEAVQGLQFAGFDVMSVATNHAKDCGLVRGCVHDSFLDTLANLHAAGIRPVGGGVDLEAATAPVVIAVHGVRFAFLGFSAVNDAIWADELTPGTAPFRTDVYTEAVRRAREQAEVVVVLVHWGREFSPLITWLQRRGAQEMVEAGATLIVGNNPHRVQGVERFPNGALVAYALGNFVFDQTWSDGTLYTIQGVMLRATFRGPHMQDVELIPIHIYDDFQPRLAPPEEAADILRQVAESLAQSPVR